MNIIETVKKTLSQCPKIDDFCNGLHVDFSENKSGDFGPYWLEKQKHIAVTAVVDGKEMPGEITKMSCANAMLFAVPTGNVNDGVTYQLQIYAEYTIESEEF